MTLRVLIAEDEPLLAASLAFELRGLRPGIDIVATAGTGTQAIALIAEHRPDVAFLDIRMPGASGLEVAEAVAEDWPDGVPLPLLVFVTAYDQYAVEAFDRAAVDYLMKPVQSARLAATLARIEGRLGERRRAVPDGTPSAADAHAGARVGHEDPLVGQLRALLATVGTTARSSTTGTSAAGADPRAAAEPPTDTPRAGGTQAPAADGDAGPVADDHGPLRLLRAGVGDTVRMIRIDEVICLQATDKYVAVLTEGGESLIREPLKDLMPRLDAARFVQIHRSTVVNLDYVLAAVRDDAGKVTLRLRGRPEKPVVSRLYTHLFKAM